MPGTVLPRRPRALLLTGLLAATALVACAPPSSTPSTASPAAPASSVAAGASASARPGSCSYLPDAAPSKPVKPPAAEGVKTTGTVKYTLEMTGGPVTITMDRSEAPCTVNSFVSLADQGFFDGTACHRLADSGLFVLQCGDPTGTGSGGPGYSFADELTGRESYTSGVVAMANSGPDTNGSQFFLVWEDSTGLPPNYTIFGQMDKASRDVVARMAAEGQDGRYGNGTGKPNNPSKISKVRRG